MQLPKLRVSRPRLTYANVASTFALVLALSMGGAYAHGKIGPNQIKQNAVKSRHIGFQQVQTPDLDKNAVSTNRIKAKAVTRGKLAPNARVNIREYRYGGHDFGTNSTAALTLPGNRTLNSNKRRSFAVQLVNQFDIGIMAPNGTNASERYRVISSCFGDPSVLCVQLVAGTGSGYEAIRVFETFPTSSQTGPTPRVSPRGNPAGR